MPKRLGLNRLGAETTWCPNVCKLPECSCGCRKESCSSDYLALNLLGCEYSYSVILVITVFPYTGAVTGTELGDEFYIIPLEINIVAFHIVN